MSSLLKRSFLAGLLLFSVSLAHAGEFENRQMADALFDFFEDEFSLFFSPATNSIATEDGTGYYRAYPNNTYLWHSSGGYIYYYLLDQWWYAGTIREVNDWLCDGYCIRAEEETGLFGDITFTQTGFTATPSKQTGRVDYYNPVSYTTNTRYANYDYAYNYGGYNYYLYNPRNRYYASSDWWNWYWW